MGAWAFNRVFHDEGLSAEVSHPPKRFVNSFAFICKKDRVSTTMISQSKLMKWLSHLAKNESPKTQFFRFLGHNSFHAQATTPKPAQNRILTIFLTPWTNFRCNYFSTSRITSLQRSRIFVHILSSKNELSSSKNKRRYSTTFIW